MDPPTTFVHDFCLTSYRPLHGTETRAPWPLWSFGVQTWNCQHARAKIAMGAHVQAVALGGSHRRLSSNASFVIDHGRCVCLRITRKIEAAPERLLAVGMLLFIVSGIADPVTILSRQRTPGCISYTILGVGERQAVSQTEWPRSLSAT